MTRSITRFSTLIVALFMLAAGVFSGTAKAETSYSLNRDTETVHIDWADVPSATEYFITPIADGIERGSVSVGSTSRYSDTSQPNVTYSYRVSARIAVSSSDPGAEGSEYVTKVLFTTAPTRYGFSVLSASIRKVAYNKATVSYASVHGVQKYEIYRSTKKSSGYKKISQTSALSSTVTLPSLNTTYYYKVRGVQVTAKGTFYTNWSAALSARGSLGKSSLKVGSVTYNSVKLSWTKADGATKYKIYRSTKKTKGYTHIKTTSRLSYVSKSLKTGTRYYFKVIPYRSATKGSTTKVVSAQPNLKKATITRITVGLGSAKVSWSKVSGATGYKVYRATSKNGKYTLVTTTKSRWYTNKNLKHNKTYYYKVKPYRNIGNKKVQGGSSKEYKIVTPRKADQYRINADSYFVLEVNGYGYYSVCASTRCDWSYDENDSFQNKAYVYVPAGYYLTFSASSKDARITDARYYHQTQKSSFTKAGHYLVGYDLKPGMYKITSSKYYYYSVCEWLYCNWGNGYDSNDLLDNGGTRYVTLQDGDFLTISGAATGVRL